MNRRLSQNASNPNHALTEDSVPNTKLHRRLIDNMQQSSLSGNDNGRHEVEKLASSGPEVRISTPTTQAKAPQNIAQSMDGDTSQFHFGTLEQNNAVMQLALSNLLGGLHNQTPQQQVATVVPTPANLNLYLQLLQLHQQQNHQPQQQTLTQRGVGASMGGLNPLTQALWATIASQHTSSILSEYSSETDASGRWTTGGGTTTEGRSGSSIPDKQQGRLLVPCRARGMSVEHNFQTAYFEISPDIKHGDGLICSFPACRNRGVKFLYCAYCKDPVAKRNFRNQHSHSEGGGEEGVLPQVVAQQSIARMAPVKEHDQDEATPTGSSAFATSKKRRMDTREHRVDERGKVGTASGNASSEGDRSASVRSYENDEISKKIASIDNARRSAWERLLVSRPSTDDNEELAAWLIRVMAVSDMKKPFRYGEEESS